MDAFLHPLTGDYTGARTHTLHNAVYLRLATPLGSYWADPLLGSRLHELQRSKDLPRIAVLACQYTEQALAPLLKDGRALSIDVTTSRPEAGRLMLHIDVTTQTAAQRFDHMVRIA